MFLPFRNDEELLASWEAEDDEERLEARRAHARRIRAAMAPLLDFVAWLEAGGKLAGGGHGLRALQEQSARVEQEIMLAYNTCQRQKEEQQPRPWWQQAGRGRKRLYLTPEAARAANAERCRRYRAKKKAQKDKRDL